MAQKLWIEDDPLNKFSEAIRTLRETLFAQLPEGASPVMIMTATHRGDGCSTVTANLAASCAHTGRRVLAIDGDFSGRGLEEIFGISHKAGLLEYIGGNRAEVVSTGIDNLGFLPAGITTSGAHPFDSPKFGEILENLRKSYDVIMIDTAPVLEKSDAVVLGQKSNGVILVFLAGNFLREDELTAREILDRSNVRVIGVIFNRIREEDQDPFYTYQRYLEKQDK